MGVSETTPWLYELPKETVDGNSDYKIVLRALQCFQQGRNIIEQRRDSIETIYENDDNAFSTDAPEGNQFMESKLAFNMEKKVFERIKFPEFDLKIYPKNRNSDKEKERMIKETNKIIEETDELTGELKTPEQAQEEYQTRIRQEKAFKDSLIKAGTQTVMEKAGISRVMKQSDDSAFWRAIQTGDAFIMIASDKEGDFPIRYDLIDTECVMFMEGDKEIRGASDGRNVQRVAIVYRQNYDEYRAKLAKQVSNTKTAEKAQWGMLPELEYLGESQAWETKTIDTDDNREGQVSVYIDLEAEEKIILVGGKATIIQSLKDAKFPYKRDGKLYIPLIHIKGVAKDKRSVHNYGVGHYAAQLNRTDKIIKNEQIAGTIDEINPIPYMQVQSGQSAKVQGLIYQAQADRKQGFKTVVIDEMDASKEHSLAPVQSLTTGASSKAKDIVKEILDEDIRRFGVSIDAVETPPSKTATAIISEDAEANTLSRTISSRNAPEYKFLIETTIDLSKKFIKKNDKTPINISEIQAQTPAQEAILRNFSTLGDYKRELENNEVKVKMNVLTGAIPNIAVTLAKGNAALGASIGTPAAAKVQQKLLGEYGYHFDISDLQIPQAPVDQQKPQEPQPISESQL